MVGSSAISSDTECHLISRRRGSPDDGSGVRRADLYAALGRALLMRGKRKASARLLNRSEGIGGGAQTDELSQLLTLFGQRARRNMKKR